MKLNAWLKIIRIQFYPMTWIAYSIGAAAYYTTSKKIDLNAYLLGYSMLFLIELCTILTNEYFDFNTDRINKNAGHFNGGSRVLVENKLGFKEIRVAIFMLICLIFGIGYLLLKTSSNTPVSLILFLLFLGLFLGLGYTAPPFKFCYRGLGEIVVGITHSPYVILCGYIFQSGSRNINFQNIRLWL